MGRAGAAAAGGGVEIPPNATFTGGATVTITDSLITGNQVEPTSSIPNGNKCPGHFAKGECPFSYGLGGGIDSWGRLTLLDTTVSHNRVGPYSGEKGIVSDAVGGGIYSDQGGLTLTNCLVSDNQSVASAPDGRYAEGGGVEVGVPLYVPVATSYAAPVTLEHSAIIANEAVLTSHFPYSYRGTQIAPVANTGGIFTRTDAVTTINDTQINHNDATAADPSGEPSAIDAAININDGPLAMNDAVISGNISQVTGLTSTDVGGSGTAFEVNGGGTIANSLIANNRSTMTTPHGAAAVTGTLGTFDNVAILTVRKSTIKDNTLIATSDTGSALVQGAGIFNDGLMELIGDRITDNHAKATGPAGAAQGAGIWNGSEYVNPPVTLNVKDSIDIKNNLTGTSGITLEGGGLFTMDPATLTLAHTRIAHNVPNQCSGC